MVDAMQPSFVGRARELEALTGALTHVRAGQSRVVLVLGEAGVGKTALLRRFLDAAPDLRVVLACGDESETPLPYGLVDQLARRCGKARAAPLVQVMADPAVDPLRIGAELLDLLGAVQATGPVAVVVDDAQWADSSSLRAMTFALRRLSSDAVLALIAARAADAATLPAGLNRLVDSECGVRLRLDGFTTEEVRELAKVVGVGQLPLQAAERLRAHTAGLPLHVAALLEELPSDVLRQLSKELPAPRSFSQLVRSRVAGCSPAATALVRAAAVLGSPSPLALAARLAELEHPVVPLDEAVDRQLLVEASADGAPGVAFPHPLVGAAIYADLGPARRTALHSRAAGLTTGEVALTHRVAATTRPDGALAAELRSAARAATGRGALSGAARQLLQAASVSPAGESADRLLCDAVESMLAAGDVASASAVSDRLAGLPASPRRSHLLGQLALFAGRQEDAEQLLVTAWGQCGGAAECADTAAQVATLLAQLVLPQCRASEAIQWSERALALAGHAWPARGHAKAVLATSLGISGRADDGIALLSALPSSTWLPGEELDGLTGRGLLRLWTDDLAGACADLAAVVDAARTRPPAATYLQALGYLAEVQYRVGAWQDATVSVERAIAVCEYFDQAWLSAFVHALAGFLQTGRGDWAGAQTHVREAGAAAERLGDSASLAYAVTARAELAFAQGHYGAVLEAVEPLAAMGYRDGVYEPAVFRWRELYADSLVRLGRDDDAERVLVPLEALAASRGRHSASAGAARVRGCLEASRGASDRATAAFAAALAHLGGLTMPYLAAQVRLDYGIFLRRTGQRRAAAVQLDAAATLLRAVGAEHALERCRDELVACGLHPGRSSARPVQGQLTPRELAVARLVAEGRSNREVATELFVSVKTVEFHLRNVFVKCRVNSRAELFAKPEALRSPARTAAVSGRP